MFIDNEASVDNETTDAVDDENTDTIENKNTNIEIDSDNTIVEDKYVWIKAEIKSKASILPDWLTICNSLYYRKAILNLLGENLLPKGKYKEIVPLEKCYNQCNIDLLPVLSISSKNNNPISKPRKGILPTFALELLEQWSKTKALNVASSKRRFALPGSFFMEENISFHSEINRIYTIYRQTINQAKKDKEELKQRQAARKKTSGAVTLIEVQEQLNTSRITSDNNLAHQMLQQNQSKRVQLPRLASPLISNLAINTLHIENNQSEISIHTKATIPSTPTHSKTNVPSTPIQNTTPVRNTPKKRRVATPPPLIIENRIASLGLFSPADRFTSLLHRSSPSNRFGIIHPLHSPSRIGSRESIARDTNDFISRLPQSYDTQSLQVIPETQLDSDMISETQYNDNDDNDEID
ncbi:hypothetical protein BOTCAL_0075g00280 [Botryotinia calthae]|uniref:Uncharacterized protein n=1 Tax=Botryotinia calthae TaxID=38488 RepID=A0A4Y8D8G0_9HELO|nr:hypothetical protein BOTCAL_0075g00280 [Botryotinia calthae]